MKKLVFLPVLFFLCWNIYSQTNWTKQQTGVSATLNSIFFLNENTGFCVGANSTFLYTTNSGTNWNYRNIGTGTEWLLRVYFLNDSIGFVIYENKVMKTMNRGVNWSTQTLGCYAKDIVIKYTANGTLGFIGGSNPSINGVIYRTYDQGISWNICGDFQYKDFYGIDMATDSVVVAVGSSSFLARSVNMGNNWSTTNIGTVPLLDIHFPGSQTGYICGGTLAKTTNAGLNWFGFVSPGSNVEMNSIHFPTVSIGYSTGSGYATARIQKTTNAGTSWTEIGSATDTINYYSVRFVNNNTGWICGTYGTIKKTTNGGVTQIKQISNEIPASFSLKQNYPNPFNPFTNIKYQITNSGFVVMKVYDAPGKEIATLVNENLNAGEYEVTFDGSNLPSGIYFYKLQVGDFTEIKKMALVK